jgi:hypothetical protein
MVIQWEINRISNKEKNVKMRRLFSVLCKHDWKAQRANCWPTPTILAL